MLKYQPDGSLFRTCNAHALSRRAINIRLDMIGGVQQTYCTEMTQYNETASSFYTEKSCSCFSDNCNGPENDGKLPQLKPKSLKCAAQACIGNGSCVNMTDNGCMGQYCFERKNRIKIFLFIESNMKTFLY